MNNELTNIPLISIGDAAKFFNVSIATLRRYEKEGLVIFSKGKNQRRLLSSEDIQYIQMIKDCLNYLGCIEKLRKELANIPCWEYHKCSIDDRDKCEGFRDIDKPCWSSTNKCQEKCISDCRNCFVYKNAINSLKSLLT